VPISAVSSLSLILAEIRPGKWVSSEYPTVIKPLAASLTVRRHIESLRTERFASMITRLFVLRIRSVFAGNGLIIAT
jgi:hypothetical protein